MEERSKDPNFRTCTGFLVVYLHMRNLERRNIGYRCWVRASQRYTMRHSICSNRNNSELMKWCSLSRHLSSRPEKNQAMCCCPVAERTRMLQLARWLRQRGQTYRPWLRSFRWNCLHMAPRITGLAARQNRWPRHYRRSMRSRPLHRLRYN